MKKPCEPAVTSPNTLSVSSALTGARHHVPKDHYRIVVMGAAGVGKTCIVSQFLYEKFVAEYKETVEELHRGQYEVHGKHLTLDILDTSGSYEFPAMRTLSISTGDAFVLVYSVGDEESFDEVKRLRDQVLQQKAGSDQVPIVIVGNKADIDDNARVISPLAAETTVNIDWGNGYVEASAKDNFNIVGIFKELLTQAKVSYALSPAIRRRRLSLPQTTTQKKKIPKLGKRHSCSIS